MKTITIILLTTLFASVIGGCQTGTEPAEEIDADFLWRICNEHDEYYQKHE